MRSPTIVLAGLSLAASSAFADPTAADLQAQGEDLAKQGRYSDAIDSFKAADKLQPTATHACLIALAYTRRELWPQAEIWLALCQVRANPSTDPLPDWAPAEQDQINERLAAANVAKVEITVEPPDAGAKLTVSSFAPDEQFSPRTIHLPPGIHQIIAAAPGYKDEHQLLDIKDKSDQHVVIKLHKPNEGVLVPPPPPPKPAPTGDPGKKYMIAGGIVVGAGFVTWGVLGIGWNTLSNAKTASDWSGSVFHNDAVYYGLVGTTVGLWAVGAGLFAYGYYKHSHHDESATISVAPLREGGGMVSVGWTR